MAMTTTRSKTLEYTIVRDLLLRREGARQLDPPGVAERLIAVLAATAVVFLLGAYLQELLWVALAVATVIPLGASNV